MYYVYSGHRCFDLYAHGLVYELQKKFPNLQFERRDVLDKIKDRYICFFTGANEVPPDLWYIMYNAEPMNQERWMSNENYWKKLSQAKIIWNYCIVSTRILRQDAQTRNIPVYTIPFGCPFLFLNFPSLKKKYDVGFVGSINARRESILTDLTQQGVKIASPRSHSEKRLFGDEFIRFVRECKIMLAISTFNDKEDDDMFRISLLLSLGCLVIAEETCNCEHFALLHPSIIRAPLDKWGNILHFLIQNDKHRSDMQSLYTKTWTRARWSNFIERKMLF